MHRSKGYQSRLIHRLIFRWDLLALEVVRSLGLHKVGAKEEEAEELHPLILQHLPWEAHWWSFWVRHSCGRPEQDGQFLIQVLPLLRSQLRDSYHCLRRQVLHRHVCLSAHRVWRRAYFRLLLDDWVQFRAFECYLPVRYEKMPRKLLTIEQQ